MATPRSAGPAARRIVRLATGMLRERHAEGVPTKELASACGVAPRTLHRAFRLVLGVSPQRYLLRIRLEEARHALAEAGAESVTAVAMRCGFGHLGRFAALYRARFGESPSSTRTRALVRAAPPRPALSPARADIAVRVVASRRGRAIETLAATTAEAIAAALDRPGLPKVRAGAMAAQDVRPTRHRIEGRVVEAGRAVRIVLRLLDGERAAPLWGDCFEGEEADGPRLIDRAVAAVIARAVPRLFGDEETPMEAARAFPAARDILRRTLPATLVTVPASAAASLSPLAEAMELDPADAMAPALAAWCRAQLVLHHGSADPARERETAVLLADRAGALDDEDPVVLSARASVSNMAGEHARAEALAARAIAAAPGCAWAWERLGYLRAYARDSAGALACFDRALTLPWPAAQRTNTMAGIGLAHTIAERHEEGRRWTLAALAANPEASWVHRQLALSHTLCGDRAAARASVEALRRAYPHLRMTTLLGAFHHCPKPVRLMEALRSNGLPD